MNNISIKPINNCQACMRTGSHRDINSELIVERATHAMTAMKSPSELYAHAMAAM